MLNILSNPIAKIIALVTATLVVILIMVAAFLYHDVKGTTSALATTNLENKILTNNEAYSESSKKITDEAVTEFVVKKEESKVNNQKLRSDTINAYTDKIKEPVVQTPQTNVPDGADRVGDIADSMLKQYCGARTEDPRCNPQHPAN